MVKVISLPVPARRAVHVPPLVRDALALLLCLAGVVLGAAAFLLAVILTYGWL